MRESQPYPKSKQLYKKRIKFTQKQKGDISDKVRKIVNARTIFAPIGCCERCKKNRNGYWTLELAHIDSRKKIEHKTTEYDLLRLCGPSTDSETCHWWVDSTKEGAKWMKDMQQLLILSEETA